MSVKSTTKELSIFQQILATDVFQVVLLSILTAAAAQITIPVKPVPFTLQTMIVVLSGALLGPRKGAYSQFVYLVMGIAGLPVFAQIPDGAIGFARLIGPTGGYLLAFPAAAYLTGAIVKKSSNYLVVASAMFLGNAVIIISGAAYLFAFYIKDFNQAITAGVVIFSLWTVIKVIAGTSIYAALSGKK